MNIQNRRKYTEKWGNTGGLKKTPFFLRILCGHVAAHVNKVNGVENF